MSREQSRVLQEMADPDVSWSPQGQWPNAAAPTVLGGAGAWRPPGIPPADMPSSLNKAKLPSGQLPRPLSAASAKGPLRPSSARRGIPTLPQQGELFDGNSVFANAVRNSAAGEERLLQQDIRQLGYTIPEQSGSHRMRPVSATIVGPAGVPKQSALLNFPDPMRGLTAYDKQTCPARVAEGSKPQADPAHSSTGHVSRHQRPPLPTSPNSSYGAQAQAYAHPTGKDPLATRWGPASGAIGAGRPQSAPRASAAGSSSRPASALASKAGVWGAGPSRPASAMQAARSPSAGAAMQASIPGETTSLPQTGTPTKARPFSASAPYAGQWYDAGGSRPATAGSTAAWIQEDPGSRPGTAQGRPGTARALKLQHWSSGTKRAVTEAAGKPGGGLATMMLPRKMPGSARPISAFSAASAVTRGAPTSQAFSVLVPYQESVAEQPVYTTEDGGQIQTSHDVINYFTQHGHSAHKKLFYLNKAKSLPGCTSQPSPFDLVVVRAEDVEQEYWTMSVMGVVHVTLEDKEGEFLELGEWMRLQSIYSILRKLRFFKQFLLCKTFTSWKLTAKRIIYQRIRHNIHHHMIRMIPTFHPYLQHIQSIVHDLSCIQVTQINARADKLYTLEEFLDEQDKHRDKTVIPTISGKVAQIVSLLLELAGSVESELHRAENMTEIQKLKDSNFVVGMPSMPARVKGISISTLREQQQQLVEHYQRILREMARLKQLVRLVDYMVGEAYVSLAVNAAEELKAWFEDPNKVRGCFNTTIAFAAGASGYVFTPDHDLVASSIDALVAHCVTTIHQLPRPLSSKALSAKFMLPGEQILDVMEVTLQEPRFQELRDSCLQHIKESFDSAQEYVTSTFEDKRVLEHFRLSWDPIKYDLSEPNLQEMRKDLLQQRRWGRLAEQMKMSNTVGVLFVDSKKMRGTLHDAVLNTIEDIKETLIKQARKACQAVLEQARSWSHELEARPPDLDGYARLKQRFLDMCKHKDALFHEMDAVDGMFDTFKDYGGKADIKDNVQLDNLHEAAAELRNRLVEVDAWLTGQANDVVSEVAAESARLVDGMQSVLGEMAASVLSDPETPLQTSMELLAGLEARVTGLEQSTTLLLGYQKLMQVPQEDFGSLQHVRREFERRKAAWTSLAEWSSMSHDWLHAPVTTLNAEDINSQVDDRFKQVYKMCKMYREDNVVAKVKELIDGYKVYLPLFTEAANPAMQPHHWAQVFSQLKISHDATLPFAVHDLVAWGILDNTEVLSNVSAAASKEYSLRKSLAKMKEEWADKEFHCTPYKDTGTSVIGQTDEIQMLLDDQLMKIQAMNASPFVKPFKQEALAWEKTLQFLQDLIDIWVTCQSTWMYLEPIFSSEDICKQMPEEGLKFSRVDTAFRALMEEVQANASCLVHANDPERLESLQEAGRLLEEVQKGLAAYLEKKRLFFPRFFFLSNDEMLEILSETKDPTRVQPHLRKCFEGIHRLRFDNGSIVSAMTSVEAEVVPFKTTVNTVQAKGAVERWLLEVEERMFEAVHDVTSQGIAAYPRKPRHEWVLDWPGMVALVVSGIFWTCAVEEALAQGHQQLRACEEHCTKELMKIVDLVRGELTGLQRATLGALVVMDVHARDVVTSLVQGNIQHAADFEWQAQLRTYWEPQKAQAPGVPERERTVVMRMMSSVLEYGYEYLGNSTRLVITPLTDRCYRTLMGAIHMNLGGAPEGPAGTGKTETTKDLAKALARQCVVFNCSDSLDYIAMGKFFKGLAASGAWACFDEFNRIDLEVLSVVAQQVMDIQRAIAAKLAAFTFEGTDLQLRWSAWCAITMNPGYAGRSELPDNLKALFRTVAMMVPDYAMIAEIMLFSYGYLAARESAKKIVQCYKLCSEQLSSQDHYDYGMRAVMAVLRAAGNLKRRYPQEDEYVLMLRSIVDVNLCKFLSHDVPLFKGIISDLFPGVAVPEPDYANMATAIKDTCAALHLQPTEYFMLKTIQLYEMIVVRHGLMLVGLPFSGKTASYRVLAQALTLMAERNQEGQERVTTYAINPKAVTMGQLYGQFDLVSHEWSDGVLAVTFRKAASDPSTARKWLVLDGPVDAIWIENMNTVLDDNKKLCLNSGEIIQMSPQMNMIFEVADLAVASPATVSRCGMVYLEPQQLGVAPLLTSWLQHLPTHYPDSLKQRLESLYNSYGQPLARFVQKEVKEASPSPDAAPSVALMRLWQTLATPILGTPELYRKLDAAKQREVIDALFVFSMTYTLGGTAASNTGRAAVAGFIKAMVSGNLPNYKSPSGHSYYTSTTTHVEFSAGAIPPPVAADSPAPVELYDWMYDVNTLAWRKWTDCISPEAAAIPPFAAFKSITVPTVDTQTITFLMQTALEARYPLLLVGPTGTGKTVTAQALLLRLDPELFVPTNFIGFSARTSANTTQSLVDAKLDKRRKGVYGPPVGKQAVVFVDDLNMPQQEVYGAQPPIELLRQYMDHGGWYDRDNTFRTMQDVQIHAAMGLPGGGRTFITSRYLRHFHTWTVTEASSNTLMHIFSTIQAWFLNTHAFPTPVIDLRDALISATMDVYNTVVGQLLPTPTKSHYVFNLRDFSRVIQGVQMQLPKALHHDATASGLTATQQHIKLWCHEVLRVFYDRLVEPHEQAWFLTTLKQVVSTRFKLSFDDVFCHLTSDPAHTAGSSQGETIHGAPKSSTPAGTVAVTTTHLRRCFFGDYLSEMDETGTRPYNEVLQPETIIHKMEEYLMDFNSLSKRPMNLAMFLYAVEHVSRIARVLRQDGGHLLCAGMGGSGRQSLARLAGFIAGMDVFQVEISRSYGQNEWRDDLKKFCQRAGAENKPCVFLFSDSQIKAESFVEDINNLLNSGEVPNMFPYDERTGICEQVRGLAKAQGRNLDTQQELWAFFVERTRANLHLVLCFSPIGSSFRDRLRQFPSLINCCTIDWFQAWPEDALEAVAVKFLKEVDVTPDMRHTLMALCKTMHTSMEAQSARFLTNAGRHNYVTPTSYLELITMFTTLLTAKRTEVLASQQRYEMGLDKLDFTAEQVEAMRKELRALKPVLQKTVNETDKLMQQIAREKAEVVEPKKALVDAEVQAADVKAQEAKAIKEECETILAQALPALNAAIAALDTIKKADIQLVQSFKNPPAAVKLVMEAVCVLLEVRPTMVADPNLAGKKNADFWDASKKLLMDSGFLIRLKEFDRDNIPGKTIDKIRKEYTSDPEFTPANAAKASSAAEGLCKWVHAMDAYDRVAKIVAPKRESLREAQAGYEQVMRGLQAKQAELAEVMSRLATLEQQLATNMAEKDRLSAEVEVCTVKLDRAEQLISGLGGEKDRWTNSAQTLRARFHSLTGDMLVSAAVISYLGAFTTPYRDDAVTGWLAACHKAGLHTSSQYKLSTCLGDPVKIRSWVIQGLPNDTFSIDNAIMLTNARRWPLCIDPQKQANKWMKNMEADQHLVVLKQSDGDYMRLLENAIQFGLPVLLENVGEDLDPSLEPVLLKQVFKQGHTMCLKLGDAVVEYSTAFRFYITTSLRNPHYLPETAVKVTLLNFMITQEGLTDQLLGVVVAQEMPDLEEQRQELVVTSADNKHKLKEIEDQILHVLSSSSGNILEDASAVKILSEAKQISDDISIKQEVADETQVKIDTARKGYRPCGEYNAVLFFCIADLAGVDPMYQYSLSWFIALFQRSIANSARSDLLPRRLDAIAQHFTYSLYTNVCRSLFEKDKLLFSLLLSTRILRHADKLPAAEYEFFVTGQGPLPQEPATNPDPSWISDRSWEALQKLSSVCEACTTIPGQISVDKARWRAACFDAPQPHEETLPSPYDKSLTDFQRLLLLKALRPDKLVPAVTTFVQTTLGSQFTQPPEFDLAGAYAESSCSTPLLFVLSPGSDPTAALLSFAESCGMAGGKLQVISMGQGQGPKAAAMIEDARGLGTWVLMQNCHLAPSWMPSLEKICEGLSPDNTDERFRLWMTSMPSADFPPSVLQTSVKITKEPPGGLKANMKRCLALEPLSDPSFWEDPGAKPPGETTPAAPGTGASGGVAAYSSKASAIKRLLYGLVFIHAFVQERRRYGPQGWNIAYGFDEGDLRISARQVRMYVLESSQVPFAALQYAVGECNYGGRVTDDKDRRLLTTLLAQVFCPMLTMQDRFSLSESGSYRVPVDGPLDTYLSCVEALPTLQAPEVFGLSANADISKDLAATQDLLTSLVATGAAGGVAGGAQSAQQAANVAEQVKSLLARLPGDFDVEAAGLKYVVSYTQSMNQVLVQEMARFNRLLAVIRSSLVNLDKALAGLQVLSSELESVLQALALGHVPAVWKASSYPSLKPLAAYVTDLLARLQMLQDWYENGPPAVFWISGFFFTPSFMTAVLQNYARAYKLPIDSISFDYTMMRESPQGLSQPPADGCYIHGLFMDSCAWDTESHALTESAPKVLFAPAPVIWLRPVKLTGIPETQAYDCPVYRTAERRGTLQTSGHSSNYLISIRMPSLRPAAHWILRGACMLCSLPE